MKTAWIVGGAIVALVVLGIFYPRLLLAGQLPTASGYNVLEPIRHGALTIFPVVTGGSHDTHQFITLDEGLRSGEVVVSETGSGSPLVSLVRGRKRAVIHGLGGSPVGSPDS